MATSSSSSTTTTNAISLSTAWKSDVEELAQGIVKFPFFPLLENHPNDKVHSPEFTSYGQRHHAHLSADWSTHSLHFTPEDAAAIIWDDVPMGPPDAILGIAQAYKACPHPNKVNVCVGAYRDEQGKPWVLPSVHEAERVIWEKNEDKEYLPIEGDKDFIELAMKFAYGEDMPMDHVAGIQTLSGTGALRVGGTFLALFWPKHPIYVPLPSWGNHVTIFDKCGLDVRRYRYYSRAINGLDLEGMIKDLQDAPYGSIILLHACAHNPSGSDPSIEQWKKIIDVLVDRKHVAFFDSAYQGFASGNAEEDAQPFRYAVSQHVPILLAQSFAKNFGLYGERVGTLSVVCGDAGQKERILSELRCIVRPMYSSPPKRGSSIVRTVLADPTLSAQYVQECATMAQRIQKMRLRLVEALVAAGSKHDWSHITNQIGMFAYTGMTEAMCKMLTDKYYIFLTADGRMSIAGLNESNVDYVAKAIHDVTDGKSISE